MLKQDLGGTRHPIVITGLGATGGGSRNCADLWENCCEGRVTAQLKTVGDVCLPVYAVPDPNLTPSDSHLVRKAGRAAALALAAAREAWQDARLNLGGYDPARIGVIVGSSRGPADVVDASLAHTSKRPSESIYTAFSSTAGLLASAFEIQGCSLSVSATCTSGATAIYTASRLLQSGDLDIVLAGGVDAPLIPSILERMAATGVLSSSVTSQDALRPFDVARNGTVLGEGAAFVVLESAASSARRGVPSRGTLLGAALTTESHLRSRPTDQGEGLQRAIKTALTSNSMEVPTPDLIHLHGTGTKINDQSESACVQACFGSPDSQPIAWGSKGITGHTLGAASSFQSILTLLAMQHSFVPGTANCSTQDPSCNIRLSLGKGFPQRIRTALCITSGFWGKSSCLYFGAPS